MSPDSSVSHFRLLVQCKSQKETMLVSSEHQIKHTLLHCSRIGAPNNDGRWDEKMSNMRL